MPSLRSLPVVDRDLFHRYAGLSLPRHVSYPMPNWWRELEPDQAVAMARESCGVEPPRELSLYLHLPFCEALCKFCACNRTILRKSAGGAGEKVEDYLDALKREITRCGHVLGAGRSARQIHWGGGTPTYLDPDQIVRLHKAVTAAFTIAEDAEISIEIDPRVTTQEQLHVLRTLGFNRVSLGIQDFDAKVQAHVRRIQPFEMVQRTVASCRALGFESINFDLIYGMPYQTVETVRDMVRRTIELSPDRVAFYHYAQIPDKIANQRGIHHDRMPDSDAKLTMFMLAVEMFSEAGYEFIGLDHFARSDEWLSRAVRDETIHRNFQGMTTGAQLDLVGLGASAISHYTEIGYLQNVRDPDEYARIVHAGDDPSLRGMRLSRDDIVRECVINELYSHAGIRPWVIEQRCGINFKLYFESELSRLETLVDDGLVAIEADGRIRVTYPLGRVLMRNVASVFDAYLHPEAYRLGERHLYSTSA